MLKRNSYFDFLRGIAIMMVVGIHTFSVDSVNMHQFIDVNVLIRQMINCAVPIFLAISGFFLCTKTLETWDERKNFWRKQMPKVYLPTMIVSLPYFALSIYQGNNPFMELGYM